ncbi:hypothetical protein [Aliiglaciecola sp. LCG003]|uniref:hypothetical protein n=1 Tax=Aliiglaciecola sp. LCG003 TaxID=3053655 RepID=UPI00257269EF|nr:hypothetical protein [Aliiglaciecola sp. LCG003]WJG11028.1 hypothetical protein QR722_08385 [Aliiglaciecola sp. LCG003]
MSKFQLHGKVELILDENILRVEGYGPWNIESLIDTKQRVMPLMSQLSAGPWGVLVVLYGEPIYVPDAANYLVELIKELKKRGRTASAIMVEESNEPEFAKRHISSIFERAGETFRFFKHQDDARVWLIEKLAAAKSNSQPR